jgi:D-glycero-D-manno-heptose 1,7-bisphosphate phosphatase
MNKAAFFDRDGTLIDDVHYLSSIEKIELIPHAVALARYLQEQGYKLFVVSNQSGVAQGFFDEDFVQATHHRLHVLLAKQGVNIEKFYYCPHHPTLAIIGRYKQICTCRKPNPGMLLQAGHEYNLNMSASFMFGDKAADLDAGRAAGCRSYDIAKLVDLSVQECAKLLGLGA